MLISTLTPVLPRRLLTLRAAPFLGLPRAFSLTAPAFNPKSASQVPAKPRAKKAASPTKAASKASTKPPPQKIFKKDRKPPFAFPGTPFINYLRAQHTGKHGIVREATVAAGQQWALLSQAEKDAYGVPKEQLDEYYAKRREWRKTLPKVFRQRRKSRPPTSYSLFCQESYDHSLPFQDNARNTSARWHALSDAERQTYKLRADEAAKQFAAREAAAAED